MRSGERLPEEPTIKLARAWTALAEGAADKALSALQTPSKAAWATHFETVQRAFIADVAKKKAAAFEAYVAITEKKPPNARIAEAFARHLAYWGDKQKALETLAEGGAETTPLGKALEAELKAGKTPKLMVSTVEEGLAEFFLGIGQVLASNNGVDAAQIYLRLALFLNPASDIAKLELAELYGNLEQWDKAISVADTIHDGSPFFVNSRVRKALYLNALQKNDEAVALLKALLEKIRRKSKSFRRWPPSRARARITRPPFPTITAPSNSPERPRRSIGASITRAASPMSAPSNGRKPSRTSRKRWNSIPRRAPC